MCNYLSESRQEQDGARHRIHRLLKIIKKKRLKFRQRKEAHNIQSDKDMKDYRFFDCDLCMLEDTDIQLQCAEMNNG